MTTYDPEDQAERRRAGGCCRNPYGPRHEGVGAKIRQRRPSATQLVKFLQLSKHPLALQMIIS